MFKVPDGYKLSQSVNTAEKNYLIQKNDLLTLEVYANNGERIIDPDDRLNETLPANTTVTTEVNQYLVDIKGNVKLPLLGEISLAGLTIREAEGILQSQYEAFYTKPFVVLKNTAKRVIVLGEPGGMVVPLPYDNMDLIEVLALAGGIKKEGKASNIRVMRADEVFLIDLQTIEGFKKGNMIMEPGDIVYIEPIRRPFTEALKDYGPLVSIVVSLSTLIVILNNLK